MVIRYLVLIALAACDPSWSASAFPGAPVRPLAPPGRELQWTAEVQDVLTAWSAAVGRYGCPEPFRLAERFEDAYPVVLLEDREWSYPGYDGMCWYDRVEIRDVPYRTVVLAHELGHAMGLEHHDQALGSSIMDNVAAGRQIEDRDARAAACQLGCGPCNTAEEYDEGW